MLKFVALLYFIGGLFFAFGAYANGPVIFGEGGYSWYGDSGTNTTIEKDFNNPPMLSGLQKFMYNLNDDLGTGGMAGAGAGYEFSNVQGGALRLGGLFNYRWGAEWAPGFNYQSGFQVYEGKGNGNVQAQGAKWNDISSMGFLATADYDIRQLAYVPQKNIAIYPTIGFGLGLARNKISSQSFMATGMGTLSYGEGETKSASGDLHCNGGTDTNLDMAWHAQAGVGADLGANTTLSILGRYFDNGSVDSASQYDCQGRLTAHGETKSKSFTHEAQSQEIDLTGWEVLGKLTYRFGSATP